MKKGHARHYEDMENDEPISPYEDSTFNPPYSSKTTIIDTTTIKYDPVNHPSHYCEGRKYEPIDVIEDWKLDYCTGNALKYISRAGRKNDELEDLSKAVFYLNRRIQQIKKKG